MSEGTNTQQAQQNNLQNVQVTLWDGTVHTFERCVIHIPTPGIYALVVQPGEAVEFPFSSIKFINIYGVGPEAPAA